MSIKVDPKKKMRWTTFSGKIIRDLTEDEKKRMVGLEFHDPIEFLRKCREFLGKPK